jgi:DNA-binding transcriptional ArsR family regulator
MTETQDNSLLALEIFEMQARLCQAMSHATRLRIVHSLRESPQRVADLAEGCGLSSATVSHHLSVLRNSGVVTPERQGHEIIYHISSSKIAAVCDLMREVLAEQIIHQSDMTRTLLDQEAAASSE